MEKIFDFGQLAELKKGQLSKIGKVALRATVAIFLAYIVASIGSSVIAMLLMDLALPKHTDVKGAGSNVGSVAINNTINYRDLKKDILDRNLFNSEGEYPKEEAPGGPGEGGQVVFDEKAPCRKPTLPIELLGTIYLGEFGSSLATIKEKGFEVADIYRVKDAIIGNEQAVIHKIEQKRVVINNKGVKECLELELPPGLPVQDMAGGSGGGGGGEGDNCGSSVVLEESYVSSQLGEGFANILSKGRLIPQNQDNQMVGFKLIGVDSKSLFGRVCLHNGDVITQVNEVSLQQPEQGFAFYQAFQDERELRISLLRNGKTPMTINVQIK